MIITTNDDQRWIAKAAGLSVRRVRKWCCFRKVVRRDRKALVKGFEAFKKSERYSIAVERYYEKHPERRLTDRYIYWATAVAMTAGLYLLPLCSGDPP
jgi:hypothetical protein